MGGFAMQDVIVALYEEHPTAVNVRTELVKDGFATDRVELTSPHEHLQAATGPAESFKTQVMDYFRTLSPDETGTQKLSELAQAVINGASTITVHPRGEEEIRRMEAIIQRHRPRDIYRYMPEDAGHVTDRKIERAAMPPKR
jgi:hypothetical protein